MPHDVLISYSMHDKLQADAICNRLESQDIRCWIAPRDVPVGEEYADSIVQAIESSQALVLVYSKNADESEQVKREVERAVSEGIHIMPVRIDDATMSKSFEYYVGSIHWLDAMTPPLEAHIDKLAKSLNALLGRKSDPRPDPSPPVNPRTPDEDRSPTQRDSSASRSDPRPNPVIRMLWVLAVLIVVGGGGYAYWQSSTRVIEAVAGQTEADAMKTLEGQGFKVQVQLVMSDEQAGSAVGSEPGAGQKARRGSQVSLLVSGMVTVPKLKGMSEQDAKAALMSLSVGSHGFPQGRIAVDTVVGGDEGAVQRSAPGAGEKLRLGDTVTLFVAGDKAEVPDVLGRAEADAETAVQEANLSPVIDVDWQAGQKAGTVLRTAPAAGEKVDRGAKVTLVVVGEGGWVYVDRTGLAAGNTLAMPRDRFLHSEPNNNVDTRLGSVAKGARVRVLAAPTGGGWVKIVVPR